MAHILYIDYQNYKSSPAGLVLEFKIWFVCFKGRIAPLPDKSSPYLQSSSGHFDVMVFWYRTEIKYFVPLYVFYCVDCVWLYGLA